MGKQISYLNLMAPEYWEEIESVKTPLLALGNG